MAGSWEPRFDFGPVPNGPYIAPVHLVHLFTGKILAWSRGFQFPFSTPRVYLWTPPPMSSPGSPGTYELAPNDRTNLFCCGHSHLADGRVFHAGGHFLTGQQGAPATKHTDMFLPVSKKWNDPLPPPSMAWRGREYCQKWDCIGGRSLVGWGRRRRPLH